LLDAAELEVSSAAGGPVGLGDEGDDFVAAGEKRREGGDGEVTGGRHEDSHGSEAPSV